MELPPTSSGRSTKASKKNARTRKAQRRRRALLNTPVHIGGHFELRTLKRSARKQLEEERAPQLWIFPWMDMVHLGGDRGRIYPHASLLGLPTEIRQEILHMSYSMEELEYDTIVFKQKHREVARHHKGKQATWQKAVLEQLQMRPHEGDLVTILSRRIASLSQVSPIIRDEMKRVSKRWQTDLEMHLDRQLQLSLSAPKLPVVAEGYDWLFAPDPAQPTPKKKRGEVIKAKNLVSGRRVRPPKCWYCTERHPNFDPICPPARRNPEQWEKMTKKVGGWRGKSRRKPTFKGEKVVFDA